jgi:hypothetical protein
MKPEASTAEEAPPTQDVQVSTDFVLSGGQIAAATAIVLGVVAGEMPRDAGIGQLRVLFNLTEEQAEGIMGSAGLAKAAPAAPPEPTGAPPGVG